ncbi:hypothetical protein KEM55_005235 [Ascosphaera atra]|nr:hypothetical protein KEM55_005235 [Ascosphaera atra]
MNGERVREGSVLPRTMNSSYSLEIIKLEDQEDDEVEHIRSLALNDIVPNQIKLKASSVTSKDVHTWCLQLPSKGRPKTIIRKSWGGQFEVPRQVNFKGPVPVANAFIPMHLHAVLAQAAGHEVRIACQRCQQGKGAFAECRINTAWPDCGACASCGFLSQSGSCSFTNYGDRVTDTVRAAVRADTQASPIVRASSLAKPQLARREAALLTPPETPASSQEVPKGTPELSRRSNVDTPTKDNAYSLSARKRKIDKMTKILKESPVVRIDIACRNRDLAKVDLVKAKRLIEMLEEYETDVKRTRREEESQNTQNTQNTQNVRNAEDAQTTQRGLVRLKLPKGPVFERV